MNKKAMNVALMILMSLVLNSGTGHAQELPPLKDPRAVCLEMRKLIETWKTATKQSQKDHIELMQNHFREPLTVVQRNLSARYTSITQTFTRKLINDHYGLCVETGLDSEIPLIGVIAIGN